jgi:hypothetical protein
MSPLLGASDGRATLARRAVRKLISLGLTEADMIYLLRSENGRADRCVSVEASATANMGKYDRLRLVQWAIRFMMALGFSESEIAAHGGVDPSTISHALEPDTTRVVGRATTSKLIDAVKSVATERLRLLLPRIAITVLDTCCDQGRELGPDTRAEIAANIQNDLQSALVLASAPAPIVPGVHAALAQVGEPAHGLYLVKVPGERPEQPEQRLIHLLLLEHELGHILDRVRTERLQLERELGRYAEPPKDGGIA